jgi:hypothetical protein
MLRTSLRVAALAALATLVLVPTALADQVFHTSHAALHPVADAPLQSGFVNDIHSNGNVNSAHEVYHLNGALPDTTFQVQLVVYASQTCGESPIIAQAQTAQ